MLTWAEASPPLHGRSEAEGKPQWPAFIDAQQASA
jgi:hypothetical protein